MKLPHTVCLTCRVAMKGVPLCPHCKRETIDMGRDFKAPRRLDVKAWQAVEAFVARGQRGHGSYNARRIEKRVPRTKNQVVRLLGTIDEVYERRYVEPEVRKILSRKQP